MTIFTRLCPTCNGEGQVKDNNWVYVCDTCNGNGYIRSYNGETEYVTKREE